MKTIIIEKPLKEIPKAKVYTIYKKYAEKIRATAVKRNSFTRKLGDYFPTLEVDRVMIGGKRTPIYRNIDFREELDLPGLPGLPALETLFTHWKKNEEKLHSKQWPELGQLGRLGQLRQFPPMESKSPITSDFWKENIFQVIKNAGKNGIKRKEIREKTRKVLHLEIGYNDRFDELINELAQEGLIFESKTDHFKVI